MIFRMVGSRLVDSAVSSEGRRRPHLLDIAVYKIKHPLYATLRTAAGRARQLRVGRASVRVGVALRRAAA
jgi:hypothetical protein